MKQDIRIDVSRARSAAVGAAHGLTPGDLRDLAPRVQEAHRVLREDRKLARYGFYDLHKDAETLEAIRKESRGFLASGIDNLVVLGIGGSALGITTLATALKPPYYNLLPRAKRGGHPRLFVMDNIDPDRFGAMLELCPPKNTLFNVISKSGGTAETLSQASIVVEALEKNLGKSELKKHLVVTTGPSRGKGPATPLDRLKKRYRLRSFTVPENVGGRFSVFSPVGMFPAAMLGIDIKQLAAGCRAMDRRCSSDSLRDNPAYLRAAIHCLLCEEKGKTISVMMPYSDRLRDVADWYRQLWAESLGKETGLDGRKRSQPAGQTPVKALGVTDQHSQLQLYLEGPNDKVVTILEETTFERSLKIPDLLPGARGLGYLRGKTMNQLMAAERKATADALREAARPVIRVTLPRVNEHTLGQLLYMLEVETAMAGRLLGVNAFDQPAVESIKVFTRKYMGEKT